MTVMEWEIPEEEMDRLRVLMAACKVDTFKDLFSNALTLFRWSVEKVLEGRIIAAIDEKRGAYCEVNLDVFKNIRPS